jgi:hypothetical protein
MLLSTGSGTFGQRASVVVAIKLQYGFITISLLAVDVPAINLAELVGVDVGAEDIVEVTVVVDTVAEVFGPGWILFALARDFDPQ